MSSHFMDSNLNFRMSSHDKKIVEIAAKLKGLKPNTYARQKLVEAAERDIAEMNQYNTLILSDEGWNFFVELMKAPIQTSQNLKKAVKSYRRYFE